MLGVELNYTVTKKEFLAVVYVINKFRYYFTEYPIYVHTNHSTIRYLMKNFYVNVKVIIWLLLLQKFDKSSSRDPKTGDT